MKTLTKITYLLVFFIFTNTLLKSQNTFISVEGYVGSYTDEDAWIPANNPVYPFESDNPFGPQAEVVISENSIITCDQDFSPAKVTIIGTFIVNGSYINDSGGGFTVKSGGVLQIEGDITGNETINVEEGGHVVVLGNILTGGGYFNVGGNFIVKGNISLGGGGLSVSETGVFVADGEVFKQQVGVITNDGKIYLTNPNVEYTSPQGPANPDFSNGGVDEILAEQSENSSLLDDLTSSGIIPDDEDGGSSVGITSVYDELLVELNSAYVKVSSENDVIIEIFNLSGEKIAFEKLNSGTNEVLLPSESGIYILIVKSGADTYVKKFIK